MDWHENFLKISKYFFVIIMITFTITIKLGYSDDNDDINALWMI